MDRRSFVTSCFLAASAMFRIARAAADEHDVETQKPSTGNFNAVTPTLGITGTEARDAC